MKKADLILTADWHLRESIPECRSDEFISSQWNKVKFVKQLQKEHNCPVIHAADLFHHWKPSPYLLGQTILHIPDKFFSNYGNHDLPQHNLDLRNKSGLYVLDVSKTINHKSVLKTGKIKVHFYHYGEKPSNKIDSISKINVLVWHQMVYKSKKPYPGCTDPNALKVLKRYPSYDLIVTGDNHKPFVEKYKNRLLVNPGSLTRQEAGQKEFKPRVYLWYVKTNTIERIYLPIKKGVVNDEHLVNKKEKDARLTAFVQNLDTDWQAAISFEKNLRIFNKKNKTNKEISNIIFKSLEYEK